MQSPVLHRHRDGSCHVSHCHPEQQPGAVRFAWQVPAAPRARGRLPRRGTVLGAFGSALALATGAFWATMLVDPPTSEATSGTQVPAACQQMEQRVRPWFEREAAHRARLGAAAGQGEFNLLLLSYQSARAQCRAGAVGDAERRFAPLERLVLARAAQGLPREDD
ncbi:hypothetical protein [Methylobacterium sp. JK268]